MWRFFSKKQEKTGAGSFELILKKLLKEANATFPCRSIAGTYCPFRFILSVVY
jgi:hypothetical protein